MHRPRTPGRPRPVRRLLSAPAVLLLAACAGPPASCSPCAQPGSVDVVAVPEQAENLRVCLGNRPCVEVHLRTPVRYTEPPAAVATGRPQPVLCTSVRTTRPGSRSPATVPGECQAIRTPDGLEVQLRPDDPGLGPAQDGAPVEVTALSRTGEAVLARAEGALHWSDPPGTCTCPRLDAQVRFG